eukprot:XP_023973670.1 Sjoegren syndrome nuclear autoantigen 1 homolog [Physeter catodon]
MASHHHNANLSNCGNELLKCIEDLKRKRDEIGKQIMQENEEKEKVQRGIAALSEKLEKLTADNFYASTLIIESSQTLLHVLRRESMSLAKKVNVE